MNSNPTEAIFIATGLFTVCGAFFGRKQPRYSDLPTSVDQQAVYAARKIAQHYPGTSYEISSNDFIKLTKRNNPTS